MGGLVATLATSLLTVCVTVIATLAIALIFKTSNTTNFAQGSIAAFGCYFTTQLTCKSGANFYLSIAVGVVAGILFGLFVDAVIFRNGRNVNAVGKQIITMGLVSLVVGVIPLIFGANEAPKIPSFMEGSWKFMLGGVEVVFTYHSLICLAITIVVVATIFLLLKFSKWGLAVRATASNESTAEIMSINTHVITAATWAIAGGLGVLAAVMLAGGTGSLTSTFMTKYQVNAFLAGILGGFSTFYGPVIGAVLIPLAISTVGYCDNFISGMLNWNEVVVYIIILVIILIKPQGLFGKKIAKKV